MTFLKKILALFLLITSGFISAPSAWADPTLFALIGQLGRQVVQATPTPVPTPSDVLCYGVYSGSLTPGAAYSGVPTYASCSGVTAPLVYIKFEAPYTTYTDSSCTVNANNGGLTEFAYTSSGSGTVPSLPSGGCILAGGLGYIKTSSRTTWDGAETIYQN